MKYMWASFFSLLMLVPSLALAGGTAGGGSPPGIMLPHQQFTEIALGILRGEQIQLRSDVGKLNFDATAIDPKLGIITIESSESGDKVILQDFDKKFGNSSLLKSTPFKSGLSRKTLIPSIPKNPDVTTVPADDESGTGGGGSSPSFESEVDAGH